MTPALRSRWSLSAAIVVGLALVLAVWRLIAG